MGRVKLGKEDTKTGESGSLPRPDCTWDSSLLSLLPAEAFPLWTSSPGPNNVSQRMTEAVTLALCPQPFASLPDETYASEFHFPKPGRPQTVFGLENS